MVDTIAVAVTLRDKMQPVGNAGGSVLGVVGDKQQLSFTLAYQHVNKAADQLAVKGIQPL